MVLVVLHTRGCIQEGLELVNYTDYVYHIKIPWCILKEYPNIITPLRCVKKQLYL